MLACTSWSCIHNRNLDRYCCKTAIDVGIVLQCIYNKLMQIFQFHSPISAYIMDLVTKDVDDSIRRVHHEDNGARETTRATTGAHQT